MTKKLKVALVTSSNPQDRRSFSGTMFSMTQALVQNFGTVDYLGPLTLPKSKYEQYISKILHTLSRKKKEPERLINSAKNLSNIISKKLSDSHYDLIFAPVANMEIAFLKTEIPIVYHSDATFKLLSKSYGAYYNFPENTLTVENRYEQTAIDKARLLIYPSIWAAKSAVEDYGADENKIRVIQYGANIEQSPHRDSILNKSPSNSLKILFLAKEWGRKGGPIAFETLLSLLDRGISAELIICGLKPPKGFRHPNVKYYEYLDKNKQADRDLLEKILLTSHLLLLPTRADCSPTVLCEANAYGLPVFSTTVGGIPSIITNGVNGYLLPLDATGKNFAEIIETYVLNKNHYASINIGARNQYETTLNWDKWGQKAREAVKQVIGI